MVILVDIWLLREKINISAISTKKDLVFAEQKKERFFCVSPLERFYLRAGADLGTVSINSL